MVKKAFRMTRSLLGSSFETYTFIDIGSGKGKVVLQWTKECRNLSVSQPVLGIEYSVALVRIAKMNSIRMFGEPGNYFSDNVLEQKLGDFGDRLILYLYNPFDGKALGKLLDNLAVESGVIIYNNPVYGEVPLQKGWDIVCECRGFHPNQHLIIYASGLHGETTTALSPAGSVRFSDWLSAGCCRWYRGVLPAGNALAFG